MEIWVMMWMLQYETRDGRTSYQPRTQEVVGTRATCEKKAKQLRLFYLQKGIKYGNVYCVLKDDDE